MAVTMKRRQLPEEPSKIKVLARPPAEILDELKAKPANGAPRPFFPLIYKTLLLEILDRPNWKFVKHELPYDAELAAKLLLNRLCNQTIGDGSLRFIGESEGVRAEQDGDRIGVWPYAEMAGDLIEFGVIKPPKGKAGSKPKAAAVSPDTKPAEGPLAGRAILEARDVQVDVRLIDRHPINRHPSDATVAERAGSMEVDGQLENCEVRKLPNGRYQMISGETRWLAAKKLKWPTVRCNVITCDDIEARRRVALHNAQRKDLNSIERAKLVEELCKPIADGGNGYTRERAAQEVGLQTGSAASNLVKLLRLPEVWQERVATGQLPESSARLLVQFVTAPKLMAAIEKDWQKAHAPKAKDWDRESWESRVELQHTLDTIVSQNSRPMDDGETSYYDAKRIGAEYGQHYGRMFDRNPEIDQQVGLLEFELHGEKRIVATDVAAYEKLNIPLIKAHIAKRKVAGARSAGRDEKRVPKQLSTAELAKRKKEQAEHLRKRIQAWRHQWLKRLVVRDLNDHPLLALRICLWLTTNPLQYFGLHRAEPKERIANEVKIVRELSRVPSDPWDALKLIVGDDKLVRGSFDVVATAIAQGVAGLEDSDPKFPFVKFELMDDFAAECAIDLAEEWAELQRAGADEIARATFASFFELHQSDQLDEVLDELGVKGMTGGKSQKVKQLTAVVRNLKLPKSIKPVEKAGKRGGK